MQSSIKILYDEHELIVSALGFISDAGDLIERNPAAYEKIVRRLLSFFRNYADKYHHHKEEEILFPEMSKKNELLAEGILKEMLDNHEDFRQMLCDIENSIDKREYEIAQRLLNLYKEALLDHIAVENDEVFQVAEGLMEEEELEKIYYRFIDCDRDLGMEYKQSLADSLSNIQKEIFLINNPQ